MSNHCILLFLEGGMIVSLITMGIFVHILIAQNAETRVITLAEKLLNKDNSTRIREWTEEDRVTASRFLFLDALIFILALVGFSFLPKFSIRQFGFMGLFSSLMVYFLAMIFVDITLIQYVPDKYFFTFHLILLWITPIGLFIICTMIYLKLCCEPKKA